jgi:hypothetical protein
MTGMWPFGRRRGRPPFRPRPVDEASLPGSIATSLIANVLAWRVKERRRADEQAPEQARIRAAAEWEKRIQLSIREQSELDRDWEALLQNDPIVVVGRVS